MTHTEPLGRRRDTSIPVLTEELRNAITRFFVPLQTTRDIDRDAFASLIGVTTDMSYALKGNSLIPKDLLIEIYSSYLIICNEAPAFGSHQTELEEMAYKLGFLFYLILKDETPSDRIPGAPRIL